MKTKNIRKKVHRHVVPLAVIAIVGLSGIWAVSQSFAATTSPYGYADSCALEGGNTAIYGWAYDAQATTAPQPNVTVKVGTKVLTVATSINGYRTAPIEAAIKAKGDVPRGYYGFKAVFSGLYKGGNYAISGTVINIGTGSNTAMGINATRGVDGSTKPYFAGNVIPQACLATAPVPPPPPAPVPVPAPVPAPVPVPAPAPAPRPAPRPAPAPAPRPTPAPPAIPAPSADANGGAVAGTLAAAINVPAGNASTIHIMYGTEPALLDNKTEDQPVGGADVSVMLANLRPSTTYSYQIVRTNSIGQAATSPVANFTTAGFTLALTFVNKDAKPVAGVSATIKDTDFRADSDKDGAVRFAGVRPGDYTIVYKHNNKTQELPVTADAASVAGDQVSATSEATLNFDINVDKVSVTTPAEPARDSDNILLWAILSSIAFAVVIFLIARRHRLRHADSPYEEIVEENYHFNTSSDDAGDAPETAASDQSPEPEAPAAPVFPPLDGSDEAPAPAPAAQPARTDAVSHHNYVETPPPTEEVRKARRRGSKAIYLPQEQPEHMGLSLKEMVLQSMAEAERQQRAAATPPPEPPAPQQDQPAPQQPANPRDPRSARDPSHHYPWK